MYYSTNHQSASVNLEEAVFKSLADDQGLFMPEYLPRMSEEFFKHIEEYSFQEISFLVSKALIGKDLSDEILKKIIESSIDFDAPLVPVDENIHALELFHGPTMAFKDFGARFMARLIAEIGENETKELCILVATSGDTGSAVADGFLGVKGVKVKILYPSGKVSQLQEQQLTTSGQNITAIEVNGTFDDCQRMVKQAFQDKEINNRLKLTSANSINIARLIPQSFYYFYAYAQLKNKNCDIIFSVPSGNFGNLTAGLMAKAMGLPIHKFIAATNINSAVPEYLQSGIFTSRPSRMTISNAMDVGNPSNFSRMLELYGHDLENMQSDVIGYSFTDEETKQIMKETYIHNHYIMDPHAAVAYLGLQKYMSKNKSKSEGIFLETAHPAKFKDTVDEVLGIDIPIPDALQACMNKKKKAQFIDNNYDELKRILLD